MRNKDLSFCIVCMNRLEHLQQTLIPNIENNKLANVEFILLDYNSNDQLEYWVKTNLQEYIKAGILVFYKNPTATFFRRSHSRNMAIRLSTGDIVCNLDADNYLGEGYAKYILDLFHNNNNIFITPNYNKRDTIGRVCIKRIDFMEIKGYNEIFDGYGFEDIELYHRLQKKGLQQIYSDRAEFYKAVRHSNEMRISQEKLSLQKYQLYINYITPFLSEFLLLYQDYTFLKGQIQNNFNKIFDITDYEKMDINAREYADYRRIIQTAPFENGIWEDNKNNKIKCQYKGNTKMYIYNNENALIDDKNNIFYRILDKEVCDLFIMQLSETINYTKALQSIHSNAPINPSGFGKGLVFKNFDYNFPKHLK